MNIPAREKQAAGYEHRFHAGNTGDVLKHALVRALLAHVPGPRLYLETHAGAGGYPVPKVGEWTEGVGRLSVDDEGLAPEARAIRAGVLPTAKGMFIPGSPQVALASLTDPRDRAILVERNPDVAAELSRRAASDARVTVLTDDGLAVLSGSALDVRDARPVVLVDPPWVEKQEWTLVPDAVIGAFRRRPDGVFAIWYPVKSLTRPNAMLARLESALVPGFTVELTTAPLGLKKNRLAGSGVIFLGAPAGLVERATAIAGSLGPRLARHEGFFSLRTVSWGRRATGTTGDEGARDDDG